jgi:hypothetical protein
MSVAPLRDAVGVWSVEDVNALEGRCSSMSTRFLTNAVLMLSGMAHPHAF